jgi:hypothetical protein
MAAGCSTDPPEVPRTPEASSPFLVDAPDGYELVHAGRGAQTPEWGDDDAGSQGGFTVLSIVAEPEEPGDLTVVEATGYEGYQGGLAQASIEIDPTQEMELDGRPALATTAEHGNELLVARGDDLALGLRSSRLSIDELIDLDGETTLSDDPGAVRRLAPSVDPPEGWSVAGQATADLVVGIQSFGPDPGPPSAHSATWRTGPNGDEFRAMTLPAEAGDIVSLLGWAISGRGRFSAVRTTEVDGRSAVVITDGRKVDLATTTEWGELLLVSSSDLTEGQLVTIAESARRLTDAEWAALPSRY